jgi:hypothetical protein
VDNVVVPGAATRRALTGEHDAATPGLPGPSGRRRQRAASDAAASASLPDPAKIINSWLPPHPFAASAQRRRTCVVLAASPSSTSAPAVRSHAEGTCPLPLGLALAHSFPCVPHQWAARSQHAKSSLLADSDWGRTRLAAQQPAARLASALKMWINGGNAVASRIPAPGPGGRGWAYRGSVGGNFFIF